MNRRFVELRSWYLFESRFCNVAKGNEEGHVENLVKRAQRTLACRMSGLPSFAGSSMFQRQGEATGGK
ncbi:MAG: hypothetical protein ABFD16_02825 [Thermoguttaceae bacterium]